VFLLRSRYRTSTKLCSVNILSLWDVKERYLNIKQTIQYIQINWRCSIGHFFVSQISSLVSRTFFSGASDCNNNIAFWVHFKYHPYISHRISRPGKKESKNNPRKMKPANNRYRLLNVQHYRDLWVELLRYLFSEIIHKKYFSWKF
jgi:hypothetical protein